MRKYISIFIIILFTVFTGCGRGINTGTGKKIGQVIQIGKHGMFCDTYEGKLIRGGFNTGSGVNGGEFNFTITDEKLATELQTVMEKQQEIEVSYINTSFSGPCTAELDHFVTGYRVLSSTTPSVVVKPPVDEKELKRQELLKSLKELEESKN